MKTTWRTKIPLLLALTFNAWAQEPEIESSAVDRLADLRAREVILEEELRDIQREIRRIEIEKDSKKELGKSISQEGGEHDTLACIKKVFHQFCLGGHLSTLPSGGQKSYDPSSAREMIVYRVDHDFVAAYIIEDRVAKVVRAFRPETQPGFSEILQELESLYGEGSEQSYHLGDGDTSGKNKVAVKEGDERILYRWDREGWSITLQPVGLLLEDAVTLTYIHHTLVEKEAEKGLGL